MSIPSPRYYQLYVALRTWVRDGTYAPGAQIPTEAELCGMFDVSRITVRKALAALGLEAGARVWKSTHVRLLRDVPLALVTTFVPLDIASRVGRLHPGADLPMFELLARSGIKVREADQWIGATLAGLEAGRALSVGIGAPLLRLTRVVLDAKRRPVERVVALYRADAYQYRMHLQRSRGN